MVDNRGKVWKHINYKNKKFMLGSLRKKILVASVGVVTLSLGINAAVNYSTIQNHNEEVISSRLSSVVEGNVKAIEEWVGSRISVIEASRDLIVLENPKPSLLQASESGGFLSVYLGTPDGSIVSSDGWTPSASYDASKRAWYINASKKNETVVSEPYKDANTGKLVVTFSTPVHEDGDLYGVMGGDIVIDSIIENVDEIQPSPSSFAFLSRNAETFIAHPDKDMILRSLLEMSEKLSADFVNKNLEGDGWDLINVDGEAKMLSISKIDGVEWEMGVALDKQEANSGIYSMLKFSAITLLVIALSSFSLLGIWLRRSFRGLDDVTLAMRDIASGEGDLTRRLPQNGNDEVAQIAESFNSFVSKMESVMITIRQSSKSVREAAKEVVEGGQDLSRRTENAASSLQETSASMEEITSTVSNTAEFSRQANALADSASDVAKRGGDNMSQVVETMQGISDSANHIADIVTILDGIAFQTNLLALNASVEAARAGEQGRGFAVVANEVRQLANRSSESASEIKELIETSVSRTAEGSSQVESAGKTMAEIVDSISQVAEMLKDITSATGEQSEGIEQVNVAVSDMDRMTQENAAMVEQSTAAGQQLSDQADRLAEMVDGFTLSQDPKQTS